MGKSVHTYGLLICFLFVSCFLPGNETNSLHATVSDTTVLQKAGKPKALKADLQKASPDSIQEGLEKPVAESVRTEKEKKQPTDNVLAADTLSLTGKPISDSLHIDTAAIYKPNPTKAIWLSALCPGLGQLYNRRYWKLPFVGIGVVSMVYSISWNSKYYNAYTNAYRDITDDDATTKSYEKLLPKGATYTESQLTTVLKNRQQTFRRKRDLSFIGAVGVYLVCLLDAYVDAQLYDFDISPELSVLPAGNSNNNSGGLGGMELSLAFHF